jgi:hypothetical protein
MRGECYGGSIQEESYSKDMDERVLVDATTDGECSY